MPPALHWATPVQVRLGMTSLAGPFEGTIAFRTRLEAEQFISLIPLLSSVPGYEEAQAIAWAIIEEITVALN